MSFMSYGETLSPNHLLFPWGVRLAPALPRRHPGPVWALPATCHEGFMGGAARLTPALREPRQKQQRR